MSYRDRRLARAERLRGWAETRRHRATAALATGDKFRDDHAFNTQPGHIPERARLIAREDRAFASIDTANAMTARATEIERQADRAIYDDDPDAVERLEVKIATLEAQRERIKAENAAFRSSHRTELKAEPSAYQRDNLMPHQAYELQNLSGNLSRLRERLRLLNGIGWKNQPAPTTVPTSEATTATARAGLTITASLTTPSRPGTQPRPVWNVRGDFSSIRQMLIELGGSWYRGAFSFWEDPTQHIETACREHEERPL